MTRRTPPRADLPVKPGMKTYTPRELRSAVLLAVVITMTVMLALLDPSCRHNVDSYRLGWGRSISPR